METWLGISLDEATRMKPSHVKWAVNRYPLVDAKLTRHSCLLWLKKHGYPEPPKSACIGCPFHNDNYWRELRDTQPLVFQEAVDFDAAIRHMPARLRQPVFLHRTIVPLGEVDLRTPQEKGQSGFEFEFDEECEGYCGV